MGVFLESLCPSTVAPTGSTGTPHDLKLRNTMRSQLKRLMQCAERGRGGGGGGGGGDLHIPAQQTEKSYKIR